MMKKKSKKTMEQKIDDLALAVGRGFKEAYDRIDARFDAVNDRFEKVNQRFDQVNERLDGIEDRLERVETKVTGLSGRVDVLEETMRLVRSKLSM